MEGFGGVFDSFGAGFCEQAEKSTVIIRTVISFIWVSIYVVLRFRPLINKVKKALLDPGRINRKTMPP